MQMRTRRQCSISTSTMSALAVVFLTLLLALISPSTTRLADASQTLQCDTKTVVAANTPELNTSISSLYWTTLITNITGSTLLITDRTKLDTSSAAWLRKPFRVINGFKAKFTFQVGKNSSGGYSAEGFAFVVQNAVSPLTAIGGSSANLGYNFANNFAVEFDMFKDNTIADTNNNNHIELHTAYSQSNSASVQSNYLAQVQSGSIGSVQMLDGKAHDVEINYYPASITSKDPTKGVVAITIDTTNTITYYINSNADDAQPTGSVAGITGSKGFAYIGFTGSTSATVAGDISITGFSLQTVMIDPSKTIVAGPTQFPAQIASNVKGSAPTYLQLVDQCGSNYTVSGFAGITAQVYLNDGTTVSSAGGTSVTDLTTGAYNLYWWNSAAAIPSSALKLIVKYGSVAVAGSPFALTVIPGVPNGFTSTVSPSIPTTFIAGTAQSVTVTLKDALGNPTNMPGGFNVVAGFQSSYDTLQTYNTTTSTVVVPLQSNQAQSGVSVLIRVHDPSISPDRDIVGTPVTVNVVGGAARGIKSTISGLGLAIATAGQPATLTLSVNDAFGNPYNGAAGVTVGGKLTTTQSNGPAAISLTASYNNDGSNQWTLTYTSLVAGFYNVTATVNGEEASNWGLPYVQPGEVTRGDIATAIPNGIAGTTTTFTIQAYDGNNNARTTANTAGKEFQVTLTAPGLTIAPILCPPSPAFTPTADITSFDCQFTISGQYDVKVVATRALTYTVALKVSGGATSTLSNNQFVIKPSAPNAATSNVFSLPTTSIAGIASQFQVVIKDQYSNIRTGVDDKGFLTLVQLSALVSGQTYFATIVTTAITNNNAGVYNVTYTCGVAGVYTVSVKISGVSVPASTPTTTNLPGVMVPSKSIIVGEGLAGGIGGTDITFNVTAKDAFSNTILLVNTKNTLNTFTPQTVWFNGASNVVHDDSLCTPDTITDGLYLCSYRAPIYSVTYPSFTINVFGKPGTSAQTLAGNFTAYTAQNGDLSKAIANGPGLTNGQAGVTAQFNITDRDDQLTVLTTSTTPFGVQFTPLYPNPEAGPIGPAGVQCKSTSVTNCNPKNATFIPYKVGSYRVQIFANGRETEESKTAGSNYTLVVTAGAVSAPNTILTTSSGSSVVAGQVFTFTAQLADAYNNLIKSNAGLGANVITFDPSSPQALNRTIQNIKDNLDGTYTITVIFQTTGSKILQPLIKGTAGSFLSVDVTPGGIDGTLSTWTQVSSKVITAGVTSTFSLKLVDSFRNPLNGLAAGTCTASLTGNPSMTSTMLTSQTNDYQMSFTPTVSDYTRQLNLTVKCGAISMVSPAFQSLDITPADVDGSKSTIQGLIDGSQTYIAGVASNFTLNLKDKFNNPWRHYPYGSTLDLSLQYQRFTGGAIVDRKYATFVIDTTKPGQGSYKVTWIPLYSSPGNYTFEPFTTGGNVAFIPAVGLGSVLVLPNVAVLSKVLLQPDGLLNDAANGKSYSAGSPFIVKLLMRDNWSNRLITGGEASLISTSFYKKYTNYYCTQGQKDTSYPVASNFSSGLNTISDNNDGTYNLQIMTTVAGQYWFDLGYKGTTYVTDTNCLNIPDHTGFTITPLNADPKHTIIGPVIQGRAGSVTIFHITLFDKYDNIVVNTNHTVTTGPASLCSTNPNNYPILDFATSSGSATQFGANEFAISFLVNSASYYLVPLLLDGELTSPTVGLCPVIYVRPAPVAAVTFTSTQAIAAGLLSHLTVNSIDKFGNPVYVYGPNAPNPIFTSTFTRVSGASYVITGTSVFTSNTSFSTMNVPFEVEGVMNAQVYLPADPTDPSSTDGYFISTLTVKPAACSVENATAPYRCPSTRDCVSDYSQCPGYTSCAGVICPGTTTCVDSLSQCVTTSVCTGGTTFCSVSNTTGYCTLPTLLGNNTCPLGTGDNYCLYQGMVSCGNGLCRTSLSDCPSKKVCPPYTNICPDGVSCAVSQASCPPLPSTPCAAPYPFQCRSSICVARAEDCASEVTCSGNEVTCPDGSCQTDASKCTETFTCLLGQVKCSTGECRFNLADCPSTKTCAPGSVLCENGACAASIHDCATAQECTVGVRCPDGTCRPGRLQCPTSLTCPPGFPVHCVDGSCVRDITSCQAARVCPATASYLCPDNSCASNALTCPTTVTCPITSPVLCHDGSCVVSIDMCPLSGDRPVTCPAHHPYRCSDGTCVGSWSFCPTKQIKCSDAAPVLCPDHRCVSSGDQCISATLDLCPAGQIRCPNGGCAWSRALCPTQVTCGIGYVRGTDGSCKLESTATNSSDSASTTFVSGQSPSCAANQVICPQSHQGFSCASSLANCPQDVTCPNDKPVRCFDASCAQSHEDCYTVVPITGTTIVCPSSTATSTGSCAASTTCPSYAPTKCWDESCRVLPEDCPPQAKCDPTNYFLCSNGQCASSPLSCTGGQKCNVGTNRVKCPWSLAGVSACVTNVTQCANLYTDLPSRTCPDAYFRCRDGSCSVDSSRCASLACPAAVPYLCADGMCARVKEECNNATTGCPYYAPAKCPNGGCFSDLSVCVNTTAACSSGVARCPDGSCAPTKDSVCKQANGCDVGQFLCADGQCAASQSLCTDNSDLYNACPAWRPYKCQDGYCAKSSYLCPIVPLPLSLAITNYTALPGKASRTVRCADGSLVEFGAQCPILRPCPTGYTRCNNGQCRSSVSQCPLANPCADLFPAGTNPEGVRCPSGRCAPSLGACVSEDTGCPDVAAYKCGNGQCVLTASQCPPDVPALALPMNGCPIDTSDPPNTVYKYKCGDGSCVSDITTCPATNGCPAATPYLCGDGTCLSTPTCTTASVNMPCANGGVRCPNGQCAAQWNQCKFINGCGINTPIRCADGSCKKYPARGSNDTTDSCPTTIECDAATPYKCLDNTCVSNTRFCRGISPCPITTPYPCPNSFVCRANQDDVCPTVSTQCPTQAPVLCSNGACKPSIAQCSSQTSRRDCPVGQVRCFDGACRAKALDCIATALTTWHPTVTFSATVNHENSTCASTDLHLCPDGSCVEQKTQCGLVPACPITFPLRCANGQCVNATTTTCTPVGECPVDSLRCEDGACRTTCLPFAGCPRAKPYACYGRSDSCTIDQATCLQDSGFAHRRRLFQEKLKGQEACTDCESHVVAPYQTLQLDNSIEQTFDISVDDAAVPRTQLYVPAGAYGAQVTQINIAPVPQDGLSFSTSPTSESSMAEGPFPFSTNVLSTPFTFTPNNPDAELLSPLTIYAAIDNMIYDPNTPTDGTVQDPTVPCELVGDTFTLVPDTTLPAGVKQTTCNAHMTLGTKSLSLSVDDPLCDAIDIKGTYTGQGGAVVQPWDGTASTSCDCFLIDESTPQSQPTTPPPYSAPINYTLGIDGKKQWSRYKVNDTVCLYMTRTRTSYTMAVYTGTRSSVVCPFIKGPNALYWTMSRENNEIQASCTTAVGNRLMNPNDICLATIRPDLGTWGCLLPGRQDRLDNPPWSLVAGRPQNRVAAQVNTSTYSVLAFAYIPLPLEPAADEDDCNVWCQYKWVIIGLVLGFAVFILCMTYVLWRFKRYRDKYKEQQKNAQELKEYAREIDETRGGLGVADEEVDMMANPMVVEMKKLDEQLTQINLIMDTQKEKDTRTIEQLSQERERLHAEILRVKTQMAAQQKQAATRQEERVQPVHEIPTAVPSTSALTPMEIQSPSEAGNEPERHDFAQVRRPAKKKDDL